MNDVRRGESRSLVLRGEAGIGKSALLEHLVESAPDMTLVRADGVESEMELGFASLHQLCAPLLDDLESLPGRQREALQIVFGMTDGPAPQRFLIGLAALSLLSHAAERRPLLCVVDDAQWLDRSSALTLAFVARRLLVEPVGLVFAARAPGDELERLPQLELFGLGDDDARALLAASVQFTLDQGVRDRILAETRGNPLALLELPRGLTPVELAGGFGMAETGDLSNRIEASYVRRLESLPDDARRLLLVAAAEPVGDPLLLQRACERVGIGLDAVDATDGLLAMEVRVTFRHPLARSAVYRSAIPAERREVHFALAEVTDRDLDPDRRAWHLAAAAAGPDEAVATELELSAGRARARGGVAAAAAFFERAVALSGDPARRADRALAGAQAGLSAGAFDGARSLLAAAEASPLDALARAQVDRLYAEISFARDRGRDSPLLLLNAARNLEKLDPRLSRDTYLDAWSAGLFAGHMASEGGRLLDVSRAALAAPEPPGDVLPRDLLLDGLALVYTDGRHAAGPALRDAVSACSSDQVSDPDMLRWGFLASRAANLIWDYDACLFFGSRVAGIARDIGALEVLGPVGNACGQAAAFGGDLAGAALLAAEVDAVIEATGSPVGQVARIALAAMRGREAEARPLLDDSDAHASAVGQGSTVAYTLWSRSVLMNGLGRYDEALAAATEAVDAVPELFFASWASSELIEAAVRTDKHELAIAAFARLSNHVDGCETDWALGIHARGRALLSEGDAAEASYRDAIEHLDRTRLRPDLARAHLLYGEWLRREKRRVDARDQLRAAHDQFTDIGMEAFAERARVELLATGERARKRTDDTRDVLTPQEHQIAHLARDGLSNLEIGARLFLSPRTVEWHLRKVFTKLGIHSRRELSEVLSVASRFPGEIVKA